MPAQVSAFINAHPHFGVEPICRVLEARPGTYYERKNREPSARALRDAELKPAVQQCWEDNRRLYGARKLWKELQRLGHELGRDQTARLMRELGIEGQKQGRRFRTTKSNDGAHRPADLVDRNFVATRPNELWVTDFERHEALLNRVEVKGLHHCAVAAA